jgi:hypothetical protein
MTKKRFSLYVQNADGPIQLCLMNNEQGIGRRLLGAKGSPDKETLAQWDLSWEQLDTLIMELKELRGVPFPRGKVKHERPRIKRS